jgi:hypothetical protein
MNINMNVKRAFKVNGKEYRSVEEMPPDIRKAFEKAMASQAGPGHEGTPAAMQTTIIFNGTEYKNINAMPQEVRQLYEKVLTTAETGTLPPGLDIPGDSSDGLTEAKSVAITRQGVIRRPPVIEPSFTRWSLIVGVVLVALIILLYYVLQSRW